MFVPTSGEAWYAVHTKSRHEKNVAGIIERMGHEAFSPTYVVRRKWCDRVKDVELPLFPGYVFGRFESKQKWRIVNVPGVFNIVHFGTVLAPVDDSEIVALQKVVEAGIAREPGNPPNVGEMVEIVAGPLAGLIGPVTQVRDEMRLVLSIVLLRRSVLVHVGTADIRPLEPAGRVVFGPQQIRPASLPNAIYEVKEQPICAERYW